MRAELPDREHHRLIKCFRLDTHRVPDALVVGERDSAGPGGHEEEISCSPYVRLTSKSWPTLGQRDLELVVSPEATPQIANPMAAVLL